MLSIQDMLNPLPIVEGPTQLDLPVSPLINSHVIPELDLSDSDRPSSPRATPPSYSSPLAPHRAHIVSPARNSSESWIPPRSLTASPANLQPTVEYNVSLNRKTSLDILYHYPLGAIVEYPETSSEGCIGHLFDVLPDDWSNPRSNFVYAQGEPSGRTKAGHYIWCNLLVDSDGEKVPCREVHSTCMYM